MEISKDNRIYRSVVFSVIKRVGSEKTYLQIISIFWGIYYYLKEKSVLKIFLPFYIILGLNILSTPFFNSSIHVFFRNFQVFSLLGLTHFFIYLLTERDIKFCLRFWEIASIVMIVFEYLFVVFPRGTHWISDQVVRYTFIVGEPNFSSILFFAIFLVRVLRKEFKDSIISFILLVWAGSKTILVALISFVCFHSFLFLQQELRRVLLKACFFVIVVAPGLLYMSNYFFADGLKLSLIRASSSRYYIHQVYFLMGLKNPFGVGYFNGLNEYPNYMQEIREMVLTRLGHSSFQIVEQHSTFLQVFSEFGWLAYILFVIFLWKVFKLTLALGERHQFAYLSFLLLFLSINALNEVAVYFFLGFLVREYCHKYSDKLQRWGWKR